MPTFLRISRHSPENCPVFNERVRKVLLELAGKMDRLLKKHGVKSLGTWSVPTEHLTFDLYEAPSFEAFEKFGMEPEIVAVSEFETYEVKRVYSMEESMRMLQQFAK